MTGTRAILTPEDLPKRLPDQTVHQYGCSLLAWIVQIDREVYGLLDDEQLSLIDHVAHSVVSARDIPPLVVDRISAIRHRVMHSLRIRALDVTAVRTASIRDERPNEGPMAKRIDPPIVRPPAPAMVVERPKPASAIF
jgi:hypothetical protein